MLALALTALVLCIAAAAAAAVTLDRRRREAESGRASPDTEPGHDAGARDPDAHAAAQPAALGDSAAARHTPARTAHAAPNTVPTPIPTPAAPTNYQVELMPDLRRGPRGLVRGRRRAGLRRRADGRVCSPAGPPGTSLIAAGGVLGRNGADVRGRRPLVVAVRLSDGRRITTQRDPGVAPWRLAVWDVDILPGGRAPSFTLHDAAGRELTAASGRRRPQLAARTRGQREVAAEGSRARSARRPVPGCAPPPPACCRPSHRWTWCARPT